MTGAQGLTDAREREREREQESEREREREREVRTSRDLIRIEFNPESLSFIVEVPSGCLNSHQIQGSALARAFTITETSSSRLSNGRAPSHSKSTYLQVRFKVSIKALLRLC